MVRLPLPPAEMNIITQKQKRDCACKYTRLQAKEVEFGMCLQLWFCARVGSGAGALRHELHPPPAPGQSRAARAVPGGQPGTIPASAVLGAKPCLARARLIPWESAVTGQSPERGYPTPKLLFHSLALLPQAQWCWTKQSFRSQGQFPSVGPLGRPAPHLGLLLLVSSTLQIQTRGMCSLRLQGAAFCHSTALLRFFYWEEK